MTALVFEGVRKTFGPVVALENFDLTLRQGELVSLLGPSGCGKTTALRIAAGFERADAGMVSVNGSDITHLAAHKRNMGMVFQSYSLFPNLNVADNVEFGLRNRKVEKTTRAKRAQEILELVQLGPLAKRYPHQLSGGQQQRVALARALAVQPEVLLLDEPLSALDAKVRATLREEIRRIQTELGITTLFVTHDQEEALAISDRVCVMSNGRLEQVGTPKDVYRQPSSAFVARFVGSMNEFPATVEGSGTVRIGSTVLRVPTTHGLPERSSVLVLVRPEDLRLTGLREGTSENSGSFGSNENESFSQSHSTSEGSLLLGTVTGATFQGASTIVSVRLTGIDRIVAVHLSGADAAPTIGDHVHVAVDTDRALCEQLV
jgi:putative spermidine/putrescine transport system ATP-binding protein